MDHIYLDTSIFVKENFLEGKRIKTLLKLFAEGKFQLVMSIIAVNEVKNQFKKVTKAGVDAHNQLLNDRVMQSLRNVPESEIRSTKFPPIKKLCESFDAIFDDELEKANAIIIDYPELNIKDVFDDYFGSKFPFSSGDKKSEFPDAFALQSLIEWCKMKSVKCLVFSKDQDFLKFSSDELDIRKDYEIFLDEYLLEASRKMILDKLVEDNGDSINSKIKDWLNAQLDDISLYYEHSNYLDIHDMSVEEIIIDEKTYTVVSTDENEITIEMKVDVFVEIRLDIDDEEYGYYDDDDKDWKYFETTTKSVEQEATIPVTISFYIVNEEDYSEDYDIIEINEGNKFKVRRPKHDY